LVAAGALQTLPQQTPSIHPIQHLHFLQKQNDNSKQTTTVAIPTTDRNFNWFSLRSLPRSVYFWSINSLRTGDADLRF